MPKSERLHVIVLAGDDDSRLNPLTRALTGVAVPKQFAFIAGDSSLLQQTVASYAALVPAENIVVVVSSAHEKLARQQLQRWGTIGILARTLNRGPAVDTLLALGRVVARDPDASVVVAPAYHFVTEPHVMTSALAAAVAQPTAAIVLAGAVCPSMGDRLIVTGARLGGRLLSVNRLVDRPPPAVARRLRSKGALWDTSAFAGRACDLWRLAARKLPAEATMVASLWSGGTASLTSVEAVFRHMPTDRATATLWLGPKDLAVLPIQGSGWSAWRSPEEVLDSMGDSVELERLLSRIYRRQQASDSVRAVQGLAT